MFIYLAGEKNGKGYYNYDEKRRARPAPEVKEIIEQSIKITKIMPGGKVGLLFLCFHRYLLFLRMLPNYIVACIAGY